MNKLVMAAALALSGCNLLAPDPPPPVVEPPPPPPPPPAPVDPLVAAGLERASVTIAGPLEEALRGAIGDELGSPLTQVTARLLIWWVDVQRGMRKGDSLDVVYQRVPGREPLVHAVRYHSTKDAREYRAYLHKPDNAPFARYFQASGEEVEERLVGGPIDEYEQVTSILKDGRRHKGVDFKTPVGTPVKAPFDVVITRRNWNWKINGNCLEMADGKGRRIIFLHLDEVPKDVTVGKRYRAGEVVARSGNTGRSTAPHFHYQVESPAGKVLDPFDLHPTRRAKLEAGQLEAFQAAVVRYDQLLASAGGAPAAVTGAAPAMAAPAPATSAARP